MNHDAARLITPRANPSTAAVILPPRQKRESPPVGGLCIFGWGGRIRTYEWRDQNPLELYADQ